MSNWTHVAGIIRIDEIRFKPDDVIDFDECIGKELRFDDPIELWKEADEHPEKFMPLGSEGSLQKHVWINPDVSHLAAYTVSVFGDLRDHDDVQGIIDWFKGLCSKFCVRNAVITVDNEWFGNTIYQYPNLILSEDGNDN